MYIVKREMDDFEVDRCVGFIMSVVFVKCYFVGFKVNFVFLSIMRIWLVKCIVSD